MTADGLASAIGHGIIFAVVYWIGRTHVQTRDAVRDLAAKLSVVLPDYERRIERLEADERSGHPPHGHT